MKTKPEFTVEPRSGTVKASNLTAALMTNSMAAHEILMELGKQHEGIAGPWFDDLQAKLVTNAKRQTLEGLSIEDEAEAVQFAVDTLQMVFAFTRTKLSPPLK